MYICGAGHHHNRQMFDVESSMEEKGTAKQASAWGGSGKLGLVKGVSWKKVGWWSD